MCNFKDKFNIIHFVTFSPGSTYFFNGCIIFICIMVLFLILNKKKAIPASQFYSKDGPEFIFPPNETLEKLSGY